MPDPSDKLNSPQVSILILAVEGAFASEDSNSQYPLFLSEVKGKSILQRITDNVSCIENAVITFVFAQRQAEQFHLESVASILAPEGNVVTVSDQTKGSGCTALLGACNLNPRSELLIISANELVDVSLNDVLQGFRKAELDGATLIFDSIHPRYSYVSLDVDDIVVHAAQRQPISSNATAGVFWFGEVRDFIEGIQGLILKDQNVGGQFFIAPVFNEMILRHKKIGVHRLEKDAYVPLKNKQQLDLFLAS